MVQQVVEFGKSPMGRILIGRTVAEAGSVVAAIGTLAGLEAATPKHLEGLRDSVAKNIVLPNFDKFTKYFDAMKGLESEKQRNERHAASKEDAAKMMARLLTDDSIRIVGNMAGQSLTQEAMDKYVLNIPKVGFKEIGVSVVVDNAVNIGAFVLLNTALSKPSQALQGMFSKVFQRQGMDKEKADDQARYLVNYQLVNFAGMAASIAVLAAFAKRSGNLFKPTNATID